MDIDKADARFDILQHYDQMKQKQRGCLKDYGSEIETLKGILYQPWDPKIGEWIWYRKDQWLFWGLEKWGLSNLTECW